MKPTEINTGADLRHALADGAKLTEQWSGTAGSLYALVEYPDVPLTSSLTDAFARWPRIGNDTRVLIQAVNEYAAMNSVLRDAVRRALTWFEEYVDANPDNSDEESSVADVLLAALTA